MATCESILKSAGRRDSEWRMNARLKWKFGWFVSRCVFIVLFFRHGSLVNYGLSKKLLEHVE